MREEDAFIAAIVRDPADTTVLLVYADWLEERGDLRADFLRLWVTGSNRRLKVLAKRLDPSWVGLLNLGLRPGDEVEIIGGLMEGMRATIIGVDLKRGVLQVSPQLFCRPTNWPEVNMGEVCRVSK